MPLTVSGLRTPCTVVLAGGQQVETRMKIAPFDVLEQVPDSIGTTPNI